jgi:anti-anti-sigma factor
LSKRKSGKASQDHRNRQIHHCVEKPQRAPVKGGNDLLRITQSGKWKIVSMSGELDVNTSSSFKDEVVEQLIQQGVRWVAMDCRDLEYIDSSGLAVIVSLHKKLKTIGGGFALIALNDTLTRLFRLTSLDKALAIYTDQEDLVDSR